MIEMKTEHICEIAERSSLDGKDDAVPRWMKTPKTGRQLLLTIDPCSVYTELTSKYFAFPQIMRIEWISTLRLYTLQIYWE